VEEAIEQARKKARNSTAAAAAARDVMEIDTEPETEEEEGKGAGVVIAAASGPAFFEDDGGGDQQNDEAVAKALAEGRWVVGNLSARAHAAPTAAAAPAAAAAAAAPLIPHLFTAAQALDLLLRADPACLNELRAYAMQRWHKDSQLHVARYVLEALERLVSDGVLYKAARVPPSSLDSGGLGSGSGSGSSSGGIGSGCGGGDGGGGGGAPQFGVITHVHLIAPATMRVLQRHGSRWDGMVVQGKGEEGGEGPLSFMALATALGAEDARLKAVPFPVLRFSWNLLQSDGSILFPTHDTVALA
jgi:hypothetical protein